MSTADKPSSPFQYPAYIASFKGLQRYESLECIVLWFLRFLGNVLGLDRRPPTDDHGPLYGMFQFPYVPRPGVGLERGYGIARQAANLGAGFLAKLPEKMLYLRRWTSILVHRKMHALVLYVLAKSAARFARSAPFSGASRRSASPI